MSRFVWPQHPLSFSASNVASSSTSGGASLNDKVLSPPASSFTVRSLGSEDGAEPAPANRGPYGSKCHRSTRAGHGCRRRYIPRRRSSRYGRFGLEERGTSTFGPGLSCLSPNPGKPDLGPRRAPTPVAETAERHRRRSPGPLCRRPAGGALTRHRNRTDSHRPVSNPQPRIAVRGHSVIVFVRQPEPGPADIAERVLANGAGCDGRGWPA